MLSTGTNGADTEEYEKLLGCMVPAIDESVKESSLEKMWNDYRPSIQGAIKKIETCRSKKDTRYASCS